MHFSTFFLLLVFLWKESETILVLRLFFTEASLCSWRPELYEEMPWSESMSPIFLGHQIFLDVFLNYFIDDFIPSVFSLWLVFFFSLEHLLFKCWSISCNFVFFSILFAASTPSSNHLILFKNFCCFKVFPIFLFFLLNFLFTAVSLCFMSTTFCLNLLRIFKTCSSRSLRQPRGHHTRGIRKSFIADVTR